MKNKFQTQAKRGLTLLLITCMLTSLLSGITVFAATDLEEATLAVATAESSNAQADIDAAQVLVSSLEEGEDRTALEKRIDAVQEKVDATLFVDFEDKEIGDGSFYSGNASSSAVVDENGNKVVKITLTESNNGGWCQEYVVNGGNYIGADFTLEQAIKFEGNFSTTGEFKILDKDSGALLFDVLTNGSVLNSGWGSVYSNAEALTVGKWYNVIYKLTNNQYTLSVVDLSTDTTLFTTVAADASINKDTFAKIAYQFGGATADATGVLYVDNLKVTPASALSTARKAVVKAERTKEDVDIITAQVAVDALEEGDAKTALQARLDAIGAVDMDTVEALVLTAESSEAQVDIDAAQVAVASLAEGADRTALEKRLDALQVKIDAEIYYDNETTRAFPDWMGVPTESDDLVGTYEYFDYDVNCEGTINHKTGATLSNEFQQNPFTIKQQIKFSENLGAEGTYVYIYNIWGYEPKTKTLRDPSAWGNATSVNVAADTWYNFVYEFDGSAGKVYVEDISTGAVVGTLNNVIANYLTSDGLWYMFNDLDVGTLYIGDLVVTQKTALKTARNAVVKAERSKADTDILAAQSLVEALEDSADKDALEARLDTLGSLDEDSIDTLILKAKTTKAQADIDAAQTAVAALEQGSERTAYEEELDALQTLVDTTYYFDQNNYNPLSGWNFQTSSDDIAGYYNIIDYDNTEVTSVNHKFQPLTASMLSGSYRIEQKLWFSENIGDAFIYLQGIWGLKGINGEIRSAAEWGKTTTADITHSTWYNIIYTFNGTTGVITVENVATGEVVGTLENIVPTDYFPNNGLWYNVDDHQTGKIYVGETIFTEITPLKTARNAVVKAERSKAKSDINDAQALLNKVAAGEDKIALQRRLNVLQDNKLIFENFNMQKEQADGSFRDTDVLSSGNIKISVDAITYNSSNNTPAQLILVLYESKGEFKRLVNCKVGNLETVTYDQPVTLSNTITIPQGSTDNYQLSVFVWNGFEIIAPHFATQITSLRDAYETTEAEDFSGSFGSVTVDETVLTNIATNDYTYYTNVVFGDDGANSIEASLSGITTNGKVEVRLDSVDGQLIATIDGLNTADWDNYNTTSYNIDTVTGTHDVYLVYTEGVNVDWFKFSADSVTELPYYGAKFEPKGGMIYTGAGQGDFVALMGMTNTANQNKKPMILAVYTGLTMAEDIYNAHINYPGSIIQIGSGLFGNNDNEMRKLCNGEHDDMIIRYANQLKELPHKIFLRIGYECDGPWNAYNPELYQEAFRRIVTIFREQGADNVAYVWNISYPTLDKYGAMNYYPGDEYVDWWSYDFWVEQGDSNDPSGFLAEAKRHNKPVLVGESSKQYVQFSDAFWDKYFGLIKNNPTIKGYQYINWYWNTYTDYNWDWGNAIYTDHPQWIERYNREMSESRYIGLDASYFNTSGMAVQFGHNEVFDISTRPYTSTLFNQPWNKAKDNYTLNTGYDYTLENAKYTPEIHWSSHGITADDENDFLKVIFTVPEGKDGMIYFSDTKNQPKDVYIGDRQILSNSTCSGKFNYYASDIVDGKLTLKLKKTGENTYFFNLAMIQRISETAPAAPTNLQVAKEGRTATLTWDAVDGVQYYNIYRNGKPIGVANSATYTDTESSDGDFYSITSYDLKQGESLLSNTAN